MRPDRPIRAVIFDFDGTLTELTLDITGTIEEVKKIGLKYLGEEAVRSVSHSLISETIYAIEAICVDPEAFRKEALDKLREMELSVSTGKDLFPFTREALRALRQMGFRLGILTRACMDALTLVFPDVMDYIDAVATREEVRFVKPHPAHMEKMLEMLGVNADESIFVGDQTTDVHTGRLFNMKTIGVLTGKCTRDDLEGIGIDHVLADVSMLPAFLESLSLVSGNR
jgi:phosphoglycolate phosphatase